MDAHHVIGALLLNPQALAPTAWSLLKAEDFPDPEHRFLFELMMEAWELAGGDFTPGPKYRILIVASLMDRFGLSETSAWNALMDLEGYGGAATYPDVFLWHVERLLAATAIRRLRHTMYRFYAALTPVRLKDYDGPSILLAFDNDEAGRSATMRSLQELCEHATLEALPPEQMPDAHTYIEALMAEMRHTLERTSRAPRVFGATKRQRKELGVWDA